VNFELSDSLGWEVRFVLNFHLFMVLVRDLTDRTSQKSQLNQAFVIRSFFLVRDLADRSKSKNSFIRIKVA
jgi:hypothetical protein